MMSKRPPVGIDAIKKSVLQGMSTTLRHGLSLELEQSLRCLDTKDTVMAMEEYIKYIDANINSWTWPSNNKRYSAHFKTTVATLRKLKFSRNSKGNNQDSGL